MNTLVTQASSPLKNVNETGTGKLSPPIAIEQKVAFESRLQALDTGWSTAHEAPRFVSSDRGTTESLPFDSADRILCTPEHQIEHKQGCARQDDSSPQSDSDGPEPQTPIAQQMPGPMHPFQLLGTAAPGGNHNGAGSMPPNAARWHQIREGLNSLLINTDPRAMNAPAAVLNLNSSLLPNTSLTLFRAQEGWVLQVHSLTIDLRRLLRDHAGELEKRFTENGLGLLRVEASDSASQDVL